jgi:hypothetical protein
LRRSVGKGQDGFLEFWRQRSARGLKWQWLRLLGGCRWLVDRGLRQ